MAVKSFSLCAGLARTLLWPFAAPPEGVEHLPGGAALVACNHATLLDGVVLAYHYAWARYRPLHMVSVAEPFRHPVWGWVLRSAECIPLDRADDGGVRRMMGLALGHLARGEAVGLFPEGHLTRGPRLGRPRDGLALLALESGAPVVPTGLCGGEAVWPRGRAWPRPVGRRRRMRWRIGPPLSFADESVRYRAAGGDAGVRAALVAAVNARVMAAVAGLCGKTPPDGDA